MFKTVVLAIDGPSSEPALPVVRELADRFLSNVVIVHVTEIVPGRGSMSIRPDERRVQERLRKLLAQLHSEGINATLELHSAVGGRAAKIISESAERHDADLIVVATRGHSRCSVCSQAVSPSACCTRRPARCSPYQRQPRTSSSKKSQPPRNPKPGLTDAHWLQRRPQCPRAQQDRRGLHGAAVTSRCPREPEAGLSKSRRPGRARR